MDFVIEQLVPIMLFHVVDLSEKEHLLELKVTDEFIILTCMTNEKRSAFYSLHNDASPFLLEIVSEYYTLRHNQNQSLVISDLKDT